MVECGPTGRQSLEMQMVTCGREKDRDMVDWDLRLCLEGDSTTLGMSAAILLLPTGMLLLLPDVAPLLHL